jgi:hypothetical protein
MPESARFLGFVDSLKPFGKGSGVAQSAIVSRKR